MNITGMSRTDGVLLPEDTHLEQSVNDILTTPLGSRLMRRQYGSLLPFLIDQPINEATRLKLMAATATALITWEPRVKVRQVNIVNNQKKNGWDLEIEMRKINNDRLTTALTLTRGAS